MTQNFPATRMRRLRYHPLVRELVREVRLVPANFVLPLFVRAGRNIRQEIGSMPGHFQWSPDRLGEEIHAIADLGLGGVLLFGIPDKKDSLGSDSYSDAGIVQQGIRAVKQAAPNLLVMTDVCFCEYTDHGHCGVLNEKTGRMDVDNDATLELLAKQAVSHAKAGADIVAPSGMMDGMIGAIRRGLDQTGFTHLPIMSYAAKYASAFYGPFRDAAESAPASRRSTRISDGPRSVGRPGTAGSGIRFGRRGRHRDGQAGTGVSGRDFRRARPSSPACRWPLTMSPANTAWSKRPLKAAGWMRKRLHWKC